MHKKKAISTRNKVPTKFTGLGLVLFASIFIVVGLGIFIGLTGLPMHKWWIAQGWEAIPCMIVKSEVREHRGSDSTTYSIAITYQYTYLTGPHEQDYISDQVDFTSGSSSGRSAKADVVAQYPPGSSATCYVNPDNPAEAILLREFRLGYLIGLFGLIFTGAGVLVIVFGLINIKGNALSHKGTFTDALPLESNSTIELHPVQGRLTTFIILLIFTAIWNGIISAIAWGIFSSGGISSVFSAFFLLPFVLIGLGVVGFCIYQFLTLFNPHPHLTLTPGTIPLGQAAELFWRFDRSVERIRNLKIYLIGTESATYRQGTKTSTSNNEFEKILILDTAQRTEMVRGMIQVVIPEYTMHSFKAPNNVIKWTLRFHGEIAFWPDIIDDFEIQVIPMKENTDISMAES